MSKYDDYNRCPKCDHINNVHVEVQEDNGMTSECSTECGNCFHKDYWSYGWFMSGGEPDEDNTMKTGIITKYNHGYRPDDSFEWRTNFDTKLRNDHGLKKLIEGFDIPVRRHAHNHFDLGKSREGIKEASNAIKKFGEVVQKPNIGFACRSVMIDLEDMT